MGLREPKPNQGRVWAWLFGLGALAFWVVGLGAGWRAWILLDDLEPGRGIVAHTQAFGVDASVWWGPATVLTLTAVVASIARATRQHLVLEHDRATPGEARDDGSAAAA